MTFSQEIAFCSLSPTEILVGFGPFTASQHPSKTDASFFISDFFLQDRKPWKIPATSQVLSLRDVKALEESASLFSFDWSEEEKEKFLQSFEDIQVRIQKGELQKAVPLVFEYAQRQADQKLLFPLLHHMRSLQDGESVYGYDFSGKGMLGISPEILFERKADGRLLSMALAGTKAKEKAAVLKDDVKEKAEHEFVIEGIAESLAPFAQLKRGKTSVLVLSHLAHLCTPLEIISSTPLSFINLVEALHPTPALGCFPRACNKTWLLDQEKIHKRNGFGGPFGVRLPDGREKCVVAIRNIAWDEHTVSLASGCGVVAQSKREEEWKELHLKRNAVKKAFGLMM